jgi:hypothetical protein
VESYFTVSDTRRKWQGLKTITDYKMKPSHEFPSNVELPSELNAFYARLEEFNTVPCIKTPVFPVDCDLALHGRCEKNVSYHCFSLQWSP